MINALLHRKFMVLSLMGVMLALVSRILTVALQYSMHQGFAFPVRLVAVTKASTPPDESVFQKKQKRFVDTDFCSWRMNSSLFAYNVIFTGHVQCNGQPCAAKVDLTLNTTRNPEVHRVTQAATDGTFLLQIPLIELLHEHVDWNMTAFSPDGLAGEAKGHQILEESEVPIDLSVSLH